MPDATAPLVRIDHHGTTSVLTLDRPDRRNALSASMATAIRDGLAELGRRRETRVVVLTGAGAGFCAGADLSGERDPAPDSEGRGPVGATYRTQEHLANLVIAVHECDKPVIAAVHGAAVGGGLALALAADLRVVAHDAKFGAVFHNLGLSGCDVGVSYFLPRVVGPSAASELMLTGRIFTGAEADRLGMVNRLVDDGDVLAPALELAEAIARNSEYGVWMTKKGLWLGLDAPSLRHAVELENRTQVLGTFTGNLGEGIGAFLERRPPDWKPL